MLCWLLLVTGSTNAPGAIGEKETCSGSSLSFILMAALIFASSGDVAKIVSICITPLEEALTKNNILVAVTTNREFLLVFFLYASPASRRA